MKTNFKKPYIIAITGGSGSGKTTFIQKIKENTEAKDVNVISQDNYYKDISIQPIDQQGIENFDTPESIDSQQFVKDIKALKAGKSISIKEYTYNNTQVTPKNLVFSPTPIIIIEGIFVLQEKALAELANLSIFVHAQEHIMIKRRIIRDKIERGYDLEDVLYRYENHVMPSFEKYIKKHKEYADIVVNNNRNFDNALDIVLNHIATKITEYYAG